MKYLIAGLGNPGEAYQGTRHNAGFLFLDRLAARSGTPFADCRHGWKADLKHKGKTYILIKPATYVNLSGKAVAWWLQKEKVPPAGLLVVADDLALPPGTVRMRARGSDGGHNGLRNISETLSTDDYARLRIGIGGDFPKGGQVDYVLGRWTPEEERLLDGLTDKVMDMILDFGAIGVERTMSKYN